MNEFLTIAEIEALYPSEWLLIDEPQTSETLQLEGGKVVWHSKDRDEVHQKAMELQSKRCAVFFNGPIAEDTIVIL